MDIDTLLSSLLDCPPDQISVWIDCHRCALTISLLQAIKERFAATPYVLAHPDIAERMTRYGLLIAAELKTEPLALPLAQWARGNWAMHHEPHMAVHLYQEARPIYTTVGDTLSAARLAGNLVGVLAECGDFSAARAAYHEARPEFARCYTQSEPIYLLRLEQNYGWLLHSQGHYAEALQIHDTALTLAQQVQLPELINEIRVNRSLTLGMLGRLDTVEAELSASLEQAQSQGQKITQARIEMNLGELYTVQGRPADALRHFNKAHQQFLALENPMELGSVSLREAELFQKIGSWDAAIRFYTEALAIFQQHRMIPQVGQILVAHAVVRRMIGDYCQAELLLQQAEVIWCTLEHTNWLDRILLERMELALETGVSDQDIEQIRGKHATIETPLMKMQYTVLLADMLRSRNYSNDLAEAKDLYKTVLTFTGQYAYLWLRRRAKRGLGKALCQCNPATALMVLQGAASIDDQIRATLSVEELKAGFHAQSSEIFSDLVRFSLQQQLPWEMLRYGWRAKSAALLDLLCMKDIASEVKTDQSLRLVKIRQQLATLRWQEALTADGASTDGVREQSTPEIIQLEQKLLHRRRQRNQTTSFHDEELYQNPHQILERMEADILLEYIECDNEIIGIVVTRSGICQSKLLGDVEVVLDLLDAYQLIMQNVVSRQAEQRARFTRTWIQESLPILGQLYNFLLAPFITVADFTNIRRLLISPCASLYLLPFAALWDGDRYLMQRYEVEMIQSGALLAVPTPSAQQVSAPIIITSSLEASLMSTRDEANAIAVYFPEAISFVDEPGGLEYLSACQRPPHFLHIAAHSMLRHDAHIFSSLHLQGATLSVEQCYELPLHGTELVTLSGCTTASGLESEGALLAFQTALLVAGAKRIVSSLWPIADDATTVWMQHFYRFLASGQRIPQAIQSTQHVLLTDICYNHPAIWAAFVCSRR